MDLHHRLLPFQGSALLAELRVQKRQIVKDQLRLGLLLPGFAIHQARRVHGSGVDSRIVRQFSSSTGRLGLAPSKAGFGDQPVPCTRPMIFLIQREGVAPPELLHDEFTARPDPLPVYRWLLALFD